MAPVAASAFKLSWPAFGAIIIGCSDALPQSPADDGFGAYDSGLDAQVADISIDDSSDENASPDREGGQTGQLQDASAADATRDGVDVSAADASRDGGAGAETGQLEDATISDADGDAPSNADARGDHDDGDAAEGSTHDAGNLCARIGSMAACFNNCGSGEVCFTQVICGPLPDGGSACSVGPGTVGDDRCHRACDSSSVCSAGEQCIRYQFFGCSDYNGGPNGKGICCPASGCQ